MPSESFNNHSYSFGEYTLDIGRAALLRGTEKIALRPRSFDVLRYLVEHANQLVTRSELFAAIWRKSVVTDDCLTQCLIEIRKVMHDASREIICTLPRRGYIFNLAVSDTFRGPGEYWQPRSGVHFADAPLIAPAAKSIAVLPFVDISADEKQEYFSDGVAEEILNQLAKNPELQVVARTSSFSFKRQRCDIRDVADKLGVAWILEGSVRHSGNQVRVAAQLVNGANGMQVWSHTYDREISDVLEAQIRIAIVVATELQLALDVVCAGTLPLQFPACELH